MVTKQGQSHMATLLCIGLIAHCNASCVNTVRRFSAYGTVTGLPVFTCIFTVKWGVYTVALWEFFYLLL